MPQTSPRVSKSHNSNSNSLSEGAPADPNSTDDLSMTFDTSGDGEELHPNVRHGAMPEFEGEQNPKTGEVGGPKNEPLRWGAQGDWSYNGRVTDF